MGEEIKGLREQVLRDEELVRAFQADDKAAFDKLVLIHQDRVFNLCYRFLGNYDEADDSAQETFIKVYRSLKRFKFESAFSTWLYRVAANTCKNKLSSRQYRKGRATMRLDIPVEKEDGSCPMEIKDESMSVSVEIDRKEKGVLIQTAIDSLPQEHKEIVILRDIEGLSYEEITKITGYNPGTVKSKLARARQALREKLTKVI